MENETKKTFVGCLMYQGPEAIQDFNRFDNCHKTIPPYDYYSKYKYIIARHYVNINTRLENFEKLLDKSIF